MKTNTQKSLDLKRTRNSRALNQCQSSRSECPVAENNWDRIMKNIFFFPLIMTLLTVNIAFAANALPDVIVTQVSYANGVFTSTVKNQGAASTPAGVTIGVGYWVDGVNKTYGFVIGPLAAGASVTIGTNGGSYTIPPGTPTIEAWVDDVNRFAESNENNNTLYNSITVGSPSQTNDWAIEGFAAATG